jgi:CheY-like chemotaxis protein
MDRINLNDVVKQEEERVCRMVPETIEIEIRLQPTLGRVMGDAAEMRRILVRLVEIVTSSMPRGGRIVVETANTVIEEPAPGEATGVEPGDYAMLSVSRVGEKEGSAAPSGDGRALDDVHQAVRRQGGTLWVHSRPGECTSFKACLPRADVATQVTAPMLTPAPTGTPRGTETILVVDDERIVLRMICRILVAHGYKVLSAESGQGALEVQAMHQGAIHLLLTDVVMPGMNGKELHDEIRRHRPEIRTIFISGFTGSVIAQQSAQEARTAFLQKPFSLWDLTHKVREILEG